VMAPMPGDPPRAPEPIPPPPFARGTSGRCRVALEAEFCRSQGQAAGEDREERRQRRRLPVDLDLVAVVRRLRLAYIHVCGLPKDQARGVFPDGQAEIGQIAATARPRRGHRNTEPTCGLIGEKRHCTRRVDPDALHEPQWREVRWDARHWKSVGRSSPVRHRTRSRRRVTNGPTVPTLMGRRAAGMAALSMLVV